MTCANTVLPLRLFTHKHAMLDTFSHLRTSSNCSGALSVTFKLLSAQEGLRKHQLFFVLLNHLVSQCHSHLPKKGKLCVDHR